MRRIQVVIDPELDDWLEREAAARGISKSALVRDSLRRTADEEPFDNGVHALGLELSPLFADVEPADIDTVVYGPFEDE